MEWYSSCSFCLQRCPLDGVPLLSQEFNLISPNLSFEMEEERIEAACQTLPLMSAYFIKELHTSAYVPIENQKQNVSQPNALRIFTIPSRQRPFKHRNHKTESVGGTQSIQTSIFNEQDSDRHSVVQTLINGVSYHFNNLLMGIWGNVTLIRLNLKPMHPAYSRVSQMESMIQEGGYLIHLILGYLAERRSQARCIKMNQLLNEIIRYLPGNHDRQALAGRLQWELTVSRSCLMAGAFARIIALLIKGIEAFRRNIALDTLDNPQIQQRIGIIAALLKKAEMIISQLLCYAGDTPIRKKRTNLKHIVERQYRRACERNGHINISKFITPRLPTIPIDQKQIEWVVAQLIENAAKVLPSGGHLQLAVKPLYAEDPQERCGVHSSKDYIVITVEDNGPGITAAQQSHIFEPFYTSPKSKTSLGLGLAAANGIIRKHGGYIQVWSRQGQGGCFKIYLPIEE